MQSICISLSQMDEENNQVNGTKKRQPTTASLQNMKLLFHDLQNFHGASLDTDAAGNALGSNVLHDHDLHGADFDTLAAADTLLLIDHVHAGLGVLSDSLMLTDLHALAALNADVGLGTGALGHDLNAAQGNIIFLIESLGTGLDALQASHALGALLNSELLHKRTLLYYFLFTNPLYMCIDKIATKKT